MKSDDSGGWHWWGQSSWWWGAEDKHGAGPSPERPADPSEMTLTGQINDHTTATLGSWEIHGVWTLNVRGNSGKADFTAALSMERAPTTSS